MLRCPFYTAYMAQTFAVMIAIGECLKRMHAGEVFSLEVVSFDRKRPLKSGQVHEYPEAVLVWANAPEQSASAQARGERPPTDLEKRLAPVEAGDIERKPQHGHWYTRNIRILMHGQPTEAIVKIHPPLITRFNGETTCP